MFHMSSSSYLLRTHVLLLVFLLRPLAVSGFGIEAPLAVAVTASFLGWAFNPVGPSPEAVASIENPENGCSPPIQIPELNGILFVPREEAEKNEGESEGEEPYEYSALQPNVAIYCGAKVRPESYAPLAQQILKEMKEVTGGSKGKIEGGVLILQSPFNIYAFKPATVQTVLDMYPSIRCIAGHSIGGIWSIEYCRDVYNTGTFPSSGDEGGSANSDLSFVHLGVHSSVLSLAQFKDIPFRNVGFTYATRDVTLLQAAGKRDETVEEHLARIKEEELPENAKLYKIEGGNHSQYGSYGMPSYAQGLAYKDLEAFITGEEQSIIIAKAIVDTMVGGNGIEQEKNEKGNEEDRQAFGKFFSGLKIPKF